MFRGFHMQQFVRDKVGIRQETSDVSILYKYNRIYDKQ